MDAVVADFAVNVNYGDGTTQPLPKIMHDGGPGTPFSVMGNHIYSTLGAFPVVVTVTDTKHNVTATAGQAVTDDGQYQSDPVIVSDPTNPNRLLVIGAERDNNLLASARSSNNGADWIAGAASANDGNLLHGGRFARMVQDAFGDILLTYMTNDSPPKLEFAASVPGRGSFNILNQDLTDGLGVLVPSAMAIGPSPGGKGVSLWIAFFSGTAFHIQRRALSGPGVISHDPDSEYTYSPDANPDAALSDLAISDLAVGPNGDAVLVFQAQVHGPGPSNFYAVLIGNDLPVGELDGNDFVLIDKTQIAGINPSVRLAWDHPKGSLAGFLYLVYTDQADSAGTTHIKFKVSPDGGRTWGDGFHVDDATNKYSLTVDDAESPNSPFFPSIAINPSKSNGDVAVFWYDRRANPNLRQVNEYAAVYDPRSASFSENVQINAYASNSTVAGLDATSAQFGFGASTSLSFARGFLHPAWADNVSVNGVGSRHYQQFSLATSAIAVAHVVASSPVVKKSPKRGNAPAPAPASRSFSVQAVAARSFARPASTSQAAGSLSLAEGETFQGIVATISDADGTLQAADFTATIDWGDGSAPTLGTISAAVLADGPGFNVTASHVYAGPGSFILSVKVHDNVHGLDAVAASDASQTPGSETDGSVAVDPTHPDHLFMVSTADGGLAAAASSDGGITWSNQDLASGQDDLPQAAGDAKVAFDAYGNLFLTYVTADDPSAVVVALSTDGGQTFSVLDTITDSAGVVRPSLATGPGQGGIGGTVWVSFTRASDESISTAGAAVTGLGVVGDFNETTLGTLGATEPPSSDLAVGPNGEVLDVFQGPFVAPSGSEPGHFPIVVSLDAGGLDGTSYSSVVAAKTQVGFHDLISAQNTLGIDAQPHVAWDLSTGPHHGRAYLVFVDAATAGSTDTNIFVRYSDDKGMTWSDPVRVNDDQASASQFLPSIAVDPTTGDVAVSWYDTRHDPNNVKTEVFAAISSNGGQSFSPNTVVSPGSSDATDPDLDQFGQQNQFGSFTGLVFQNGTLFPVWTDNSVELGRNLDLPNFDIAVGHEQVVRVSDLPLTAQGLGNQVLLEGIATGTDLASFTDADLNANVGLYTATIDWRDQSTLAAGVIRAGNGQFIVDGAHAYAEEGSYSITITIHDRAGASSTVTLSASVSDSPLKAGHQNIKPIEGQPFTGVVATFIDPDAAGALSDYATTIDWGDGQPPQTGKLSLSGDAGLAVDSEISSDTFYAIGNFDSHTFNNVNPQDDGIPYLFTITLNGKITPSLKLGPVVNDGLARNPDSGALYTIANDAQGASTLEVINPKLTTVTPEFGLGSGFTGGLAYVASEQLIYAIATDAAGVSTLDSIALDHTIVPLFSLGSRSYGGLTYNINVNAFFAIGTDAAGASTLYRIDRSGTVTPQIPLGDGFTGGLAYASLNGASNFYAIGGSGAANLYRVDLNAGSASGAALPLFEVDANFNDGVIVTGSHIYSPEEQTAPVNVSIQDLGAAPPITITNTATVVDQPPLGLPAAAAITAFQGASTGSLNLASFTVPGGLESGTGEYTAQITWDDGQPAEAGTLSISGGTITVSGSHTYSADGALHPHVTLTDDTGNSATVTATINVAPDVSMQVRVVGLGGALNPSTRLITSSGTITNIGGAVIAGPLYLIVHGLPAGVTLANAAGTMLSAEPFYVVDVSQLDSEQTFAGVNLEFSDPALVPFTYNVTVIDGPAGSDAPAGTIAASGASGPGFVANQGQTDPLVRFLSQGNGYTLFLTSTGAVLGLPKPGDTKSQAPSTASLGLTFVGANLAASPVGLDPLAGWQRSGPLALERPVVWYGRVPRHLPGHHARLPQCIVAAARIRFHGRSRRRPRIDPARFSWSRRRDARYGWQSCLAHRRRRRRRAGPGDVPGDRRHASGRGRRLRN